MEKADMLFQYLLKTHSRNDWFECPTRSQIEQATGLNKNAQQAAFRFLIKNNLIKKRNPIRPALFEYECSHIGRQVKII